MMWWLILSPLRLVMSISIVAFFFIAPFYRIQPANKPLIKTMSLLVFLAMCIPFYEADDWHNTVFNSALLQFVDWLVRWKRLVSEYTVISLFVLYNALKYLPYHTLMCIAVALFYWYREYRATSFSMIDSLYSMDRSTIKNYVLSRLYGIFFAQMTPQQQNV